MNKATMSKSQKQESTCCADCGNSETFWASINHGVLLCHQCAIVHRSLGRFISQLKPLQAKDWRKSQLQMVFELYHSGSNSIWEHTLLDPSQLSKSSAGASAPRKKPEPNDALQPTKSDFIRAKYQNFAYVNRNDANKETNKQEFETDISEQLHSSVRTPNLKTSLRLLAAGANPNYIHSEKYNSPLHMAAKSGQLLQIELLLIYGANITLVDAKNKTAIDYAQEGGHTDIVARLVEHQFDLTDTLTGYICGGRQPHHQNGEHFLIIDIRPECLHAADCDADKTEENIRSMNTFRNESRQSIQSLNNKSFQELVKDIYDEIDRREINQHIVSNFGAKKPQNGGGTALVNSLVLPFLPVYHLFNSTRNQGRQKLALLNTKEFTLLIVDILSEVRRRVYGFDQLFGLKDVTNYQQQNSQEFDDIDSEPLYDSVPSEADYDECNERMSPVLTKEDLDKKYVSMNDYSLIKDQMLKSAQLMEQFFNENKLMRNEIGRLQSSVDKLVGENAQLRQLVLTSSKSSTSLNNASSETYRSHSAVYDSSLEHLNRNSYQRNSTGRSATSGRTQSSSAQNYRFSAEGGICGKPPASSSSIVSPSKPLFSHSNNQQAVPSLTQQSPQQYSGLNILHSPNSSTSSLSSLPHLNVSLGGGGGGGPTGQGSSLPYNPYQIYYEMNSGITAGSASGPFSSQPNSNQFSPIPGQSGGCGSGPVSLTKSHSMPTTASTGTLPRPPSSASSPILPSKDEVIKKIELITNSIKELLSNARECKHDEFTVCSERICNFVDEMIALFPDSIGFSESQMIVAQALTQLQDNAFKLHEECNSYELAALTGIYSNAQKSNENKIIYNSVIDKAAEVAGSVKQIVGFYSV